MIQDHRSQGLTTISIKFSASMSLTRLSPWYCIAGQVCCMRAAVEGRACSGSLQNEKLQSKSVLTKSCSLNWKTQQNATILLASCMMVIMLVCTLHRYKYFHQRWVLADQPHQHKVNPVTTNSLSHWGWLALVTQLGHKKSSSSSQCLFA